MVVLITTLVVGLLSSMFVMLLLVYQARDVAARDCEQRARGRDEVRTQFLRLYDAFPESEEARHLKRMLNEDFPALVCDGQGRAVEVQIPAGVGRRSIGGVLE